MTQENLRKPAVAQPCTDAAFILSLVGGILITLGSVFGMGLVAIGRPFFWGMMGYYNYPYMMGGYYNGSYGFYGWMYGLETLGLVVGILVIAFALLMRSKPQGRKTYGVLILVFSIISFVGMGGFFIGAILGLVGGVLALTNT